jgi:hypothetical protein
MSHSFTSVQPSIPMPSPTKPDLHVHSYEPGVFAQSASGEQGVSSSHSLISVDNR